MRPRAAVRLSILLGIAALSLGFSTSAGAASSTQNELTVLQAVNKARAAHGLRPLILSPWIQGRTREYARTLIRRDVFTHSNVPPGIGEVLAWGTKARMTPRKIAQKWLNSPSHRALLLHPKARKAAFGLWGGKFKRHNGVRMAVGRVSIAG